MQILCHSLYGGSDSSHALAVVMRLHIVFHLNMQISQENFFNGLASSIHPLFFFGRSHCWERIRQRIQIKSQNPVVRDNFVHRLQGSDAVVAVDNTGKGMCKRRRFHISRDDSTERIRWANIITRREYNMAGSFGRAHNYHDYCCIS